MDPSASTAIHFTRRMFLRKTGALLAGSAILPHLGDARGQPAGSAPTKGTRGAEDAAATIEREVIWNGRQTGKSWFLPRTCLIPSAEGAGQPVGKTKDNEKVMRWRAPLFMAAVEPKTLRLIRATERVVFPLDTNDPAHVARMGNFHPLTVSPAESWVTTGEERPSDGWKGDLLLARIRWSKPT